MGKQDAKRISRFPPETDGSVRKYGRKNEGGLFYLLLLFFFYYAVLLTRGINTHHPGYIIAFSLDGIFATKERRAAFISAFAAHVKAQLIRKHGRSTVSIYSPSNISSSVPHQTRSSTCIVPKKFGHLETAFWPKKENCIRFVARSLKTTKKRNDPLLSFLVSSILGRISRFQIIRATTARVIAKPGNDSATVSTSLTNLWYCFFSVHNC